jgi:Leucine-rich repeat (LRR) protein
MKLSNLISVLFAFKLVNSITIDCTYSITFDKFYACTNLNLDINKNNVEIGAASGTHVGSKQNKDVQAIYFLSGAMKKLPRGVFKVFTNIRRYIVHGLDTVGEYLDENALVEGDFFGAKSVDSILIMTVVLEKIRAKVFEGAYNLNHLTLEACRISTIDKDAFHGLKKLQSLGLKFNYISSLDPKTFAELGELQHLLMSGNYLKTITKDHLKGLKKIVRISLIANDLKDINKNVIEGLNTLEYLYLDKNICINKHFGSDGVPFTKFNSLIATCSKQDSLEEKTKKQQSEIQRLEKEIGRLQKLIEKYRVGNCNGPKVVVQRP